MIEPLLRFEPTALSDPYAIYRELREKDPVHWYAPSEGLGAWHVTRYTDVATGLRDPRLSAGNPERMARQIEQLDEPERARARRLAPFYSLFFLTLDPPDHTRLRSLVTQAFTPRVVETLRKSIQARVDECLDNVQDAGGMEVIRDLAYTVPAGVMADLFGLPATDGPRLQGWSARIVHFFGGQPWTDYAMRGMEEMAEYMRGVITQRRAEPGEDFLSGLVAVEQAGDRLSESELLATSVFLLFAGHETTTNLIANGLLALLRHPDQLHMLRENLALMGPAVEELLRYDSPAQFSGRSASEDLEIGGRQVEMGQRVVLWRGSANRDPRQFSHPDQLDISRPDNRHLSFGHGIHYCLGAALARLEGQIAIRSVLERFPGLTLSEPQLQWRENIGLRGLKSLSVSFE